VEAAGVAAAAAMEVIATTTTEAARARDVGGATTEAGACGHMARECPKKEEALLVGIDEEPTLL
jgi:hypothetical protein